MALCRQSCWGFEEKITVTQNYTQGKIAENLIGAQDVINRDEVPLTCLSLRL